MPFLDRIIATGFLGTNVKKLREARNVPALIAALKHNDPDIQYGAAEALGDLRDVSAIDSLVEALRTSEFSGVRWKSAEALSRIGGVSVDALISALSDDDEDVRWKAAIALGETGSPKGIEPLITLLCDEDRFVKSRAAAALGMIGEPAVEPLIRTLSEGDGDHRWGAAIALGKIRDPRSIEPLIRALADKYENVRAESAASLAAIGKPAVGPLLRFLKYTGGPARIEVVAAIGQLRDEDAIQPLFQLLENADDEERKAIADAIDAILIPSVEPFVDWIRNGNDQKDPVRKSGRTDDEGK